MSIIEVEESAHVNRNFYCDPVFWRDAARGGNRGSVAPPQWPNRAAAVRLLTAAPFSAAADTLDLSTTQKIDAAFENDGRHERASRLLQWLGKKGGHTGLHVLSRACHSLSSLERKASSPPFRSPRRFNGQRAFPSLTCGTAKLWRSCRLQEATPLAKCCAEEGEVKSMVKGGNEE